MFTVTRLIPHGQRPKPATLVAKHALTMPQRLAVYLAWGSMLINTQVMALPAPKHLGFLNAKGVVASVQKALFLKSIGLMLTVVIPVILLSILFGLRYRRRAEGKAPAGYAPDLKDSALLETVWWLIPTLIVVILAIMVWRSTHQYDPYKPLDVPGKPIHIQVVALPWRWLFLYPEQHIATLNSLTLPANQPIHFHLTADAPMSSFMIPQLGGQIYLMAGMQTQLHLDATQTGEYEAKNMQFNGPGFADMHCPVHVISPQAFRRWAKQQPKRTLSTALYRQLALPNLEASNAAKTYRLANNQLFTWVMERYKQNPSFPKITADSIHTSSQASQSTGAQR